MLKQDYSQYDIFLLEQLALLEVRESFWKYRQYINHKLVIGWWQRDLAIHLQQFYEDFKNGNRPILVIEAPPQHGKSTSVIDFISWASGKEPNIRFGFASYSDTLGTKANLALQKIFESRKFAEAFPYLRIATSRDTTSFKTREKLDYVGAIGGFRNTTVEGSITGEPLDIGIIDDPIKGHQEASSPRIRQNVWDWFLTDWLTRFSENSGMIFVMTRWHIDDPIGRLIKENKTSSIKVVTYKAIAEADELPHRVKGQALFPEMKSLAFLNERKEKMASHLWAALYQQSPIVIGGEIIKGSYFKYYTTLPRLIYRVIFVDTAQKVKQSADRTVFECWGKGEDGKIYLVDLIKGKWDAVDLELNAITFWQKQSAKVKGFWPEGIGELRYMLVEDTVSGTGLIQRISRKESPKIPIKGITRTKDKLTRVSDVLGYIESGYVVLPLNAPFTSDFVSECEAFTADDSHQYDDQVDPMVDAIETMLIEKSKSIYKAL